MNVADAGQVTRLRHVREHVIPIPRGPVRELVLPLDDALEVHAPDLVFIGRESEGLERDGNLGRPARVREHGRRGPLFVPVGGQERPLVSDERVEARAAWVDAKQECVAVIVVRIEDHREGVVGVERVVSPQLRGPDLGRHAVGQRDTDVEVRVVVDDSHIGGFGGDVAFARFLLPKLGNRLSHTGSLSRPSTTGPTATRVPCAVGGTASCACAGVLTHSRRATTAATGLPRRVN